MPNKNDFLSFLCEVFDEFKIIPPKGTTALEKV